MKFFCLLLIFFFVPEVQSSPSGTLTSNSPCTLLNGESTCDVELYISVSDVSVACVWRTFPSLGVVACGASDSWMQTWPWANVEGHNMELRAHNDYPANDPGWPGNMQQKYSEGLFLDEEYVDAVQPVNPSGTLTSNSPCTLLNGESTCDVELYISVSDVSVACVWRTFPSLGVVACGASDSWMQTWPWANVEGHNMELRAHNDYPANDPGWPGNMQQKYSEGLFLDEEYVDAVQSIPSQPPSGELSVDNDTCQLQYAETICSISTSWETSNANFVCLWVIEESGIQKILTCSTNSNSFTSEVSLSSTRLELRYGSYDYNDSQIFDSEEVQVLQYPNTCYVDSLSDLASCIGLVRSGGYDNVFITKSLVCNEPCEMDVSNISGRQLSIYGASQGTTISRNIANIGLPLINASYTENLLIKNLSLNEQYECIESCGSTINISRSNGVTIKRININNSKRHGVAGHHVTNFKLKESTVVASAIFGVWLGATKENRNIIIDNNYLYGNNSNAILINCIDCSITNNVLENNHNFPVFGHSGGQLLILGSDNLYVSQNQIINGEMNGEEYRTMGIEIDGDPNDLNALGPINNLIIEYNSIINHDGHAVTFVDGPEIWMYPSFPSIIAHNTMINNRGNFSINGGGDVYNIPGVSIYDNGDNGSKFELGRN